MPTANSDKNGAEVLLEQLESQGAERVFAPPSLPCYHNFPRSHPLYGAGPVEPVLGEPDAILLAGCNAPWHPPLPALREGCAVIRLEEDPHAPAQRVLGIPDHPYHPRKHSRQSRCACERFGETSDAASRTRGPVGPLLASRARQGHRAGQAGVVPGNEHKPFTQYRGWAGALGMSLGTALGVKRCQS